MNANGAGLLTNGSSNAMDQVGIKGSRHPDRLGKQ